MAARGNTLIKNRKRLDSVHVTNQALLKTMSIITKNGSSEFAGFVMKKGPLKEDKVELKHISITISADQLEWNSSEGWLLFSGNVVADSGNDSPIRASTMKYDLATGRTTSTNMKMGFSVKD